MRLVCVCYAGSLVVRYSFTHKPFTDLSTLTVSPCVTRVQCLSPGPTVFHRFFFSHGFTNFELISSQTQFSEKKNKHTQAAHSNAAEEHISRMINKNKTSSHSSLYLTGKLLFTKSVKTHIDNPFY